MTRTATINIRRTPRGMTIRATGDAAQALVDVILNAADQVQHKVAEEWPRGATVKLHWVEGSGRVVSTPGACGWAKRGPAGELLSIFSGIAIDPSCWDVVEERTA